MNKKTETTLHHRTFSLLPLQEVLSAAEIITPSRPVKPSRDADEMLAMKLIERIKHPQAVSFLGVQIEPPQPLTSHPVFEMEGTHA